MDNLKENDLEKWIRTKLWPDYVNPKYNWDGSLIINEEEYNKLDDYRKSVPCKYDFLPGNKRFHFTTAHPVEYNDGVYKNNKNSCDIFVDDINTNRIVVYVWKGCVTGYIISNEDFSKYDYWNRTYMCDGINVSLDLPYLYKIRGLVRVGTVELLKDLIINSYKFILIMDVGMPKRQPN